MPRVRKIPQRMCIGCQEMKPKKQLLRIVRTPDEKIEIDPTGKISGRGAYICPAQECLAKALKGKKLEKALQRQIGKDLVESLKEKLVE